MPKIVIADTSCFILLDKIDSLSLLQAVYQSVYTTPQIANEFGKALPSWVIIETVAEQGILKELERELDAGEASALALSEQFDDVVVVLDDWMARRVAEKMGISYTGTFGVMAKAKRMGIISSVKPLLEKVRHTNFRFSEQLFEATLIAAGENQ